jgi:hypothetical protein
MLRGGAALGMAALGDLLDDLGGEGVEVAGVTRGDEALIEHHRGIVPLGAGVDHVGLDRVPKMISPHDFTP